MILKRYHNKVMGGPTDSGSLSLPKQALLVHLKVPNSDNYLNDETTLTDEELLDIGYALPVSVYAAVGGTGAWFSDATTPITRLMSEILADPTTNAYHIGASLHGGVWVYDPYTVWDSTIVKSQRYAKATIDLSALIMHTEPFVDRIGASTRTIYDLQYWTGGTGSHVSLLTATYVSDGGSGSVSIDNATGVATFTGVVFDMMLSNGSFYPCGDSTAGVLWDVSGNGRHLVYAGGACGSGKDYGSDYLNGHGVTISDGATQYMSAISFGLIPVDAVIPALDDGSGCCAFVVGG